MSHIDGTPAPAATDPNFATWSEIDAIVLQWIYGTLSIDLLDRILKTKSTAHEAWKRLEAIFLNNKASRAVALEHEFTNLTLKAMPSLEAYCQRLKELANQLADVDQPVTQKRLLLQLVRGLPTEFDVTSSIINNSSPSWEDARNMLEQEQQRQVARDTMTAPPPAPALAAAATSESPRLR
ncbi:uncharacterized protein LOC143637341 [Bidens hawaiensis]|uniref:uncharacterized protein LOC143637341 n=1 Tax=Bidens hawaiensis TaxID=980011 RepID=UPI0040492017